YDFIEIRDGTSENSDVLGRHCSNIAPAPIISSGSSLQIRFVSDYAHQGAGFSLRYEVFKTDEGGGGGERRGNLELDLKVKGLRVEAVERRLMGMSVWRNGISRGRGSARGEAHTAGEIV
ncbi:hypothetical protein KUCAC02_001123, partial [Chaenocephalus aceratus]